MRDQTVKWTVVLIASLMSLQARSAAGAEDWKIVHRLSTPGTWISTLFAGPGRQWVAGGKDIVLVGGTGKLQQHKLDGLVLMTLGSGPDGALYGAGNHGTIWRRAPEGWPVEHQSIPAHVKVNARRDDLLVGIWQERGTPFAYGPGDVVFVRDGSGKWNAPADASTARALRASATDPPPLDLPNGCDPLIWRWLAQSEGWLMCRDRRGYLFKSGVAQATGTLPRRCEVLRALARLGDELFASCDVSGELMRFAGQRWLRVPGMSSIGALGASESCVVAASSRTIWQKCRSATNE